MRTHWGLGSRMLADVFVPSGDSDERASFAAFQRESALAETAGALLEFSYSVDIRSLRPS